MKGIIYKAQNEQTGEIYVGATKISMSNRRKDHQKRIKYDNPNKFQKAIMTYGIEEFNWSQIDTANNSNELAKKEKEYILKYNSKNDGYNEDSGGGFKKMVYQYRIGDGILLNTFDCLENAAKVVNSNKKQISKACLSVNKVFNGFYWSYDLIEPFEPEDDQRKKEVCQFTLDGHFLAKYTSISEAARQTEINKCSIAKVCRKERNHAGGFLWKNN